MAEREDSLVSVNRSRSTLFLMEQLIVIATFAVCAAACIKILAASYFMATETRNMSNAIRAAENSAECYKAVSGDVEKTAQIMGGIPINIDGADAAIVYYDSNWRVCGEQGAVYLLRLVDTSPETGLAALASGDLSVEKLTGEEILAFSVATR